VSILKGEGTHTILYGSADIHDGLRSDRGYLARPDHAGSFPTLLVSHGRAGITSSLKALARRFARHGYAVVIPDFYRGRGSSAPWPEDRLISGLEGAHRFLASSDTPWVGDLALLGFGSGASAAVEFVLGRSNIRALVLASPQTTFGLGEVAIPTMGIYGKADEVAENREQAQEDAPQVEWVLYGSAGHDFLDESSESFDAAIAEDAVSRILDFLEGHLVGEAPGLPRTR
jgi:carboxymethylenebutenolidase